MASLTVNPDYKLIGNNIKQMRTKSQVSQQSLAKAINISQTHMSNLENGKTGVSLAIAIRISQHLKCSLDELIFGTNKKSYPAASLSATISNKCVPNHRCLSKAWQKRLIFPKPT